MSRSTSTDPGGADEYFGLVTYGTDPPAFAPNGQGAYQAAPGMDIYKLCLCGSARDGGGERGETFALFFLGAAATVLYSAPPVRLKRRT